MRAALEADALWSQQVTMEGDERAKRKQMMRDMMKANDRVVVKSPSLRIEDEEVVMVDEYLRYMQARERDKANKTYLRRSLDQ